MKNATVKSFIAAFEKPWRPAQGAAPIWLMRQAGRYLPEYRSLREGCRNFIDFCLTPELAVEATLQPIRRFGFDAAIVFSDILVVPLALGVGVSFDEGQGPVLEALESAQDLKRLATRLDGARLEPVYRALRELAATLPKQTALIGFAGAPWTLASYMVEGGTSKDFARTKSWAFADPVSFGALLALLSEAVAEHLIAQVDAGAQALQIFDSWAGVLPDSLVGPCSVRPIHTICAKVKAAHPNIPIIVFPRGVGTRYPDYAGAGDGLSLDSSVGMEWAARSLGTQAVLQGNLDPGALVAGGEIMRREVGQILRAMDGSRFVFNLGHGIVPRTPPEHVAELVDVVRAWRG